MSQFSPADVDVEAEEVLHDGFMKLRRYQLRHRKFDGGWSPSLSRELLVRRDAIGVLLYDPARDEVVLVEQFRAGAMLQREVPWLLEIVAGIIEDGEQPEQVARREAMEEAGCTITALLPVCRYFASPGGSNEYFHVFIGRVDASHAGGVHGLADEAEDIKVHVLPLSDALERVARDEINNALAIIALQWLALNRERLRRDWC